MKVERELLGNRKGTNGRERGYKNGQWVVYDPSSSYKSMKML